MQLEKTSHWLMIIGNLGLLIGIALVVVQINQNSQLVREQIFNARWTDNLNLHLAMMGDNPAEAVATAIENPSELTVEETRVLEAYVLYWGLADARWRLLDERGMALIAPPTFDLDDPRASLWIGALGNPYVKARYAEIGIGGPLVSPELRPFMSSLTGNENLDRYQRIIARIKEAKALAP